MDLLAAVSTAEKARVDPTQLPGFTRLTDSDSVLDWTRLCAAVIDRLCFVDAIDLHTRCSSRGNRKWKQHRASIAKGTSKDELDLAEDELFADVKDAAVDADASVVSPTQKERAQQLLKMIPACMKKLITDEAAEKSISKGRLTRKWILSEYGRQVRKQKIQEDFCDGSMDNRVRPKEPDAACPVEIGDSNEQIVCKTCRTQFEFTVGQQNRSSTMTRT